ncbi:MAG: NAD(P)/FAD-dependent oxidoreductase [Lachnospiraceae bacterium]|nr:NAD(P)/FAD-dependent oxidoreductase [Lachnospiraceae bacterium]
MSRVIIAGGGAAGMAAGIAAARKGHQVHIYEKNEKLGKKVYITGKGRCNVTNACETEDLLKGVVTNSRFLYSSFYGFTNQDIMDVLEKAGCPLKTERGGRVFPVSDKSSDVLKALTGILRRLDVEIHLNQPAEGLILERDSQSGETLCRGIFLPGRFEKEVLGDAVIVATGGMSYPSTGSTGDGYMWAKKAGHKITALSPALTPFETEGDKAGRLQGLALKNIRVSIRKGKKELYQEFGEMLFTHFGVSGPVLLSASSYCAKAIEKGPLTLVIDLKPALSEEQLDQRILRDFEEAKNRQFKNSLNHLLPARLIPIIIEESGIDPDKQVNEITRLERKRLTEIIKGFSLTLTGLRGYQEAIITQGGIDVKEINPSTMESKLVKGLFFAGEVLDLDAVTGGYNLQIAWSTGWAAGMGIPGAAGQEDILPELS